MCSRSKRNRFSVTHNNISNIRQTSDGQILIDIFEDFQKNGEEISFTFVTRPDHFFNEIDKLSSIYAFNNLRYKTRKSNDNKLAHFGVIEDVDLVINNLYDKLVFHECFF